ncbi:MAG: nitrate reductase cytochrome c-type subunit [Gammaproteobacteria bacterium]
MLMRNSIACLLFSLAFTAAAQSPCPPIKSVRGNHLTPQLSEQPEIKHWQDTDPQPRQFIQQPPVIPHGIDGYVINKKFNKCLTCHSWANYKETGAVKISLTHFSDREGHDLANVAARRYFCVQCHVPQTDAAPVVDNDFKSVWSGGSTTAVPCER